MTPKEPPQFIGFDDGEHPLSTAERVADLLHAARTAIVPSPHPPEPAHHQEHTRLDQISSQLALIADTLRRSPDFDRMALAAAPDRLGEMLSAAGRPQ